MWTKISLPSTGSNFINDAQLPFLGIPVGSYVNIGVFNISKSWSCFTEYSRTGKLLVKNNGNLFANLYDFQILQHVCQNKQNL